MKRRDLLTSSLVLASAGAVVANQSAGSWPLATNTYPWGTFAKRNQKSFPLHTSESLAAIAASGITGYEPILNSAEECQGLEDKLEEHGLVMHSFYVNSLLHEEAKVDESIAGVLAIARAAKPVGATILVTNPSPIRWGGTEDKTDDELRTQARALDRLGAELAKLGMTLAYHNHDSELRQGAREFHHMLTSTDTDLVKFCLDSHWVFRGCGDSQVALFDAVTHYADRIVELHLRQSTNGVWNEVFRPAGDIDYVRLADELGALGIQPHLVLEQAVEAGSPHTLEAIEAHRLSREETLKTFKRSQV